MKLDRPAARPLLVALAAALATGASSAQELLDATFHFTYIGATFEDECGPDDVVPSIQRGTLTFQPSGSVAAALTHHSSCPGAGSSSSIVQLPEPGEAAVYSLDTKGILDIEFDASAPGSEKAELWLSQDRRLFLGRQQLPGDPGMLVGVRAGVGLDGTVLDGSYHWVEVHQEHTPAGVDTRVERGRGSFAPATGTWAALGGDQAVELSLCETDAGTSAAFQTTYSVASDGLLHFGDGFVGAAKEDGSFAFAARMDGPRNALRLFVREADAANGVTSTALSDRWRLQAFGAQRAAPPPTCQVVEPACSLGVGTFDTGTGMLALDGADSWTDSTGGGGGTFQDTIPYSFVPATGRFDLGSGPRAVTGFLGESEDVAVYVSADDEDAAVGLLLREWGPLTTDVDSISVSLGGAQAMTLRAGEDRAFLPYLVLGTLSGTYPGLPLAGVELPLVVDAYSTHTLLNPNSPPLQGSLGVLDAGGSASAAFALAPGSSAGLAGLVVHHAFLVLPTSVLLPFELASNPAVLQLVP